MSMFHELMMRKKEEIMYATIKGTLTENDGVFSGFTRNSDYLKLQNNFTLSNDMELEINIRFKTPSELGTTNQYLLGINASDYSGYMGISYNSSAGQFETRLPNIQGGSYSSYPMTTNTYYSVKSVIKNNTVQTLLYDANNVLLTQTTVKTFSANWSYTTQLLTLGAKTDISASAVLGSIDLNNSYIKLGSTKYNLQAVVGYTVVGSPTITDGVVSGFSSSDYLMTSSNYTTNNMNNDDYEFCIKLTPTSSMGSECYAIKYYNNSTVRGIGIHNNKFIWSVGQPNTTGHQISIVSSFNVTTNTTYWLKGIYKNKIASLYYSLDGTNYTLIESIDETGQTFKITSAFNFGATAGSSYGLFLGSIDMKETYIKINNKLWFNGQPS